MIVTKRYRVNDLEYFDFDVKNERKYIIFDIYVFTNRVKEVIDLKEARLIQLNIRQNLLKAAAREHNYEIDNFQKKKLRHSVINIST